MEDKRTLLAFLLIGLILLVIPYYYEWMGLSPKPEGPTPAEQQPSAPPAPVERERPSPAPALSPLVEADGLAAERGPSAAPPPPGAQPGAAFTPRQISVRTPLQHFTFSTEGGVLTSCSLQNYHRVDGRPVELVPLSARGLLLSLRRYETEQNLEHVEFAPDRESVALGEGEQATLRLVADLGHGQRLVKVMTFYADRYGFDLELHYEGFDEDTEAQLSWRGGIAPTERDPDIDLPETRGLAFFNEERVELMAEDGEEQVWSDKGTLNWVGIRNKYFLSALVPGGENRYHRVAMLGRGGEGRPLPDYTYELGVRLGASGSWKSVVYLGPLDYDNLIRYQAELEQAIDFGWPVVRQVSKFLLVIFKAAHAFIPNYGWIIVLFAVVIKIIVYPLTHKTYESASKMQEIQPKVTALREKFKNDPQRLSKETMKLYKEEGVNPLGGCLPMVLQMPIFFALYNLFGKTIELRQAPFLLWIDDLSLPDEVLIGGFGLHILPILMAVSMLFQSKMTMKDPKQAVLVYLMPVMMIFIFWTMSSGLVLYWTIFNVLTILQQLLVNYYKKDGASPAPAKARARA